MVYDREMECIHSLGAEIFRRRGWDSKVSPNTHILLLGASPPFFLVHIQEIYPHVVSFLFVR